MRITPVILGLGGLLLLRPPRLSVVRVGSDEPRQILKLGRTPLATRRPASGPGRG